MNFEVFQQGRSYLEIKMINEGYEYIGEAIFQTRYDERTDCDGTIYHFIVHKEYRNQGHGERLMKEMLKKLSRMGHRKIRIIVGEENDQTVIDFLKHMKFDDVRNSEMYMSIEGVVNLPTLYSLITIQEVKK